MLANHIDRKPWYREPWPWLLVAFPLTAVVAGTATLIIALRTDDGLVANDYYKEGLAINRQLEREQKAADLGLKIIASVDEKTSMVRVHLEGKGGLPAGLNLHFVHPTRAGMDQNIALRATPGGWFEGQLKYPPMANWQLILEDAGHKWRLDGGWDMTQGHGLEFPASQASVIR